PGQVIEDKVRVANFADEPRTFLLYAADGYNTSDIGTFALRSQDEESTDVGSWISLEVDQWTVPPQSQVDIPIRVEVPAGAAPGDHVGGIVALRLASTATEAQNDIGLTVQNGIGARMYIQVEGPARPELAIDQLETTYASPTLPLGSGEATTTFRIANIGNVRLSPTVHFEATGLTGSIDEADLGQYPDLLPGSSVSVSHRWTGVPNAGRVTQSVELVADDLSYQRSSSFWVIPWPTIIAGLAIAGVATIMFRRRRARGRPRESAFTSLGVALTVLVVTAAVLALGVSPASADEPELVIRGDGPVQVNDPLVISGTGWPERNNVILEVCGNEAQNGSQDCAVTDGRTVATSSDGRFSTELNAAEPPTGCPCVVRARTVTGEQTEVSTALDLEFDAGPAAAATTEAPPSPTSPDISVAARIDGRSWKSWFGLPSERTLILTITNDGDRAVDGAVASMAWGADDTDPTGYLPLLTIDRIEPGQEVEQRVTVPVQALSVGKTTLSGELSGLGTPIPFEATTATYPAGLAIIVVALMAAVTFVVAKWLSRRSASKPATVAVAANDWSEVDLSSADGDEAFASWIEELQPASLGEDQGLQPAPSPMLLSDVHIDLTGTDPVVVLTSGPARKSEPEFAARLAADEDDNRHVGDSSPLTPNDPTPGLDDPFESDITRVVAATASLADRLRRETDSALLDHHEASRQLADELRTQSQAEVSRLRSDAESEKRKIGDEAATAKELTDQMVATTAARADGVIEDLDRLHTESLEQLEEARREARRLIDEATTRSAQLEEQARKTMEQAERAARSIRAETEQTVADADRRVAEATAAIDRRATRLSAEAAERADRLVAEGESREAALRQKTQTDTIEIIRRGAEDIVQTVLNRDVPIEIEQMEPDRRAWPRARSDAPMVP
ncbi:MAG TPA: hypothetical protein VMW08_04045, partial [Acidimicrobiales bacterium]|nr:hypothetical protein [Acidimicrobiales bacterium]